MGTTSLGGNFRRRYALGPRVLHWTMALLIVAALVFIETREYFPRGTYLRRAFREWHQQAALIAFLLLWVRIALRSRTTSPGISPPPPRWQHHASFAMHVLFYVLMFALPVLGVVMEQLDGHAVRLFGATLPQWFGHDRPLSLGVERVHILLGNVFIGALALHAAAALWHHFVLRDDTLKRML